MRLEEEHCLILNLPSSANPEVFRLVLVGKREMVSASRVGDVLRRFQKDYPRLR